MSNYFIYVLKHPLSGDLRYVGKTNDPKRRYAQHMRAAKRQRTRTPVSLWIRSLLSQDLMPTMEMVDIFDTNEAVNNAEIEYITKYRRIHRLLNVTDGSDGMTSEYAKMLVEKLGPEGLSRKSRKAMATMGKEGLSVKAIKAHQTLGVEGRKRRAATQIRNMGSKGLSKRAKKRAENLGAKRLKEIADKGARTLGTDGLKRRGAKISESKRINRKPDAGICFAKQRNKWRAFTTRMDYGFVKAIGSYCTKEEAIEAQRCYVVANPPSL